MLRQNGLNDYDIYEMIKTNYFNKDFIGRNKNVLNKKK
jgi:hypothetical protein